MATTLDSNGNGVPDFADGLRQFPDTSTWKLTQFVPFIIQTPKFFDRTAAKVRIFYSASDPNSVTRIVRSNMPGDVDYTLPSGGLMRIWTKEANSRRDSRSVRSGGDFIGSGEFTISQLQPINLGDRVMLYIEGIREGTGQISVSFDSEGNGSFETTDTVKISVAELKLVYTDISGYRQVGASTVASIPRIDSNVEPDGIAADWQPGVEDGSLMFVRLVGSQVLDKLPGGLGESQITFGNWENNTFSQLGSAGDWSQQVNGAFYNLDDTWLSGVKSRLQANSIKVPGDAYDSGKKVYAGNVYRSPIEFNLSNLSDTNRSRDLRPAVKIESQVETIAGKPRAFVIVRPAVVLVHGINSNPQTWNDDVQTLQRQGFEAEHFRVDHSGLNSAGQATFGNGAIEESYSKVRDMVDKAIASFHDGQFAGPNGNAYRAVANPLPPTPGNITKKLFPTNSNGGDAVARKIVSQKVDIVAHSYGGLLSRWYIEQSGEFEAKRNVRKVITLGTPHLGSPQGSVVKEAFKNGLIANATANDIGANAATIGTLIRRLEFLGLFPVLDRGPSNSPLDDVMQKSYDTLAINSANLKKLAGIGSSAPFATDVGYAAVSGTINTIGIDLNNALMPMNPSLGGNASYFPWISTMQGTNDGVVPDWSSKLGVSSHNFDVASNHTALTSSPDALARFTLWLNGSSGTGGFSQVPLGSTQRTEYLQPRNAANTADPKNQPPEWARFAYDSAGNGLSRDAIIKVELNPLDQSAFYGTQEETWTADPALGKVGVQNVKVTGMMNHNSIGTAQARLYASDFDYQRLLDNAGSAILQSERGTDPANPLEEVKTSNNTDPTADPLVPFAANMRLGRSRDGLTGPRGNLTTNAFAARYWIHAVIENGPAGSGTHVPGWSFNTGLPFGVIDYSPTTQVIVPAYRLQAPAVSGLSLTLSGVIPIGSNGTVGTDTLELWEDITGLNRKIHSVVVSTGPVTRGWSGLYSPYSVVVTLTRDSSNRIKGNVSSTWSSSAAIYQYLVGVDEYSSNSQVP